MSDLRTPSPQDAVEALVQADPRVQTMTAAYRACYEQVFAEINKHIVNMRPGALFSHLTEKDARGHKLICRIRNVTLQGGIAQVEWDIDSGLISERLHIVSLIELIQHHIGAWLPQPPEAPEETQAEPEPLFGGEEEDQPTAD